MCFVVAVVDCACGRVAAVEKQAPAASRDVCTHMQKAMSCDSRRDAGALDTCNQLNLVAWVASGCADPWRRDAGQVLQTRVFPAGVCDRQRPEASHLLSFEGSHAVH